MQKFRVRSIQKPFGRTWQFVVEVKCAVGDNEVGGDEFTAGCYIGLWGYGFTQGTLLRAGKAQV